MSEPIIREYAQARGVHPQTLERWLSWKAPDRDALANLALDLRIGENHLRDLMDWLEELALRDGAAIAAILANGTVESIASDPRLGRADKLKRIKEQVRRLRFPRLAQIENEIRVKIQALKLPPGIRLSVPPGLEGGRLQVELNAATSEEFASLSAQLNQAVAKQETQDIFQLLAGQQAGARQG
ncbi:MAG TPA: hypothetical protein VMT22_02885 [Terriglobales bacterium]|jgi:hypothetical protein|nr:hypothetical protein [Terriglobales bacterium]